ncbi:MFS transporter [Duganella hordei]|uniref:MFS transporter n=1 Tax=Duganella hordei TaxID=2865934 RepID=UPI0030E96BBE
MSQSIIDYQPAAGVPDQHADRGASLLTRMESVPISRWHIKARVVMGSATFFDAFDALSLAYVLPVLIGMWHLKPADIGVLIATGYLGQLIGALFFGWLAERVGRVKSEFWTILLMSVMSLACALTGNFGALMVCRFIQGIGVGGGNPVAAVYINELSQAHNRGRFFMLYELIFPIGLLAAAQAGALMVPNVGWQSMFLVGGIPGLLIVGFIWFLPESPRWLIGKGRYDEAEKIIEGLEASTDQRIVPKPRPAAALAAPRKAGMRELFSSFYRKRTLVVWALWGIAYFVANGLNNWLPSLYKTVYHLPLGESLRLASMSNVLSVIFVLVCAFLVDRVGRRRWAMCAFGVAAVLLVALYLSGAHSAYTVMLLGSTAYAVIGTVTIMLFLYTPEIYPTRMRAIGTSLATSWFRAASAASPAIVGVVLGSNGVAVVFLMFAGVCVLGIVAARGMTETRQKSLEEIAP